MIEIEKTETCGWEAAIRGMRNPLNSWAKSDSYFHLMVDDDKPEDFIGRDDLDLMERLCKAGTEHRKFMRMITVTCDINAPLYWWKEFDTYKVGTVSNSCSTMHKIASRHLTLEDFSYEHLLSLPMMKLEDTIESLNIYIDEFNRSGFKEWWWQIIQLLPSSYNQKRTVQMNYEVLSAMYRQRKVHKLDEWHYFCDWVESLPYSELITLKDETNG